MKHARIVAGERFNSWRVLCSGIRAHYWRCRCACGFEKEVYYHDLLSSRSTRCVACARRNRPVIHGNNKKHRMTPEYRAWAAMKARCNNKNSSFYERYGGRGISVCRRWLKSFEEFLADVGPRPSPEHSLDRIDNDGDYEYGNVRWATRAQQSRNKRNSVIISSQGLSLNATDWCARLGISKGALRDRIRKWGPEKAVSLPRGGMHWRSSRET